MRKVIIVMLAVLFLFSAVAVAEEVKSLNVSETLKKIPAMDNGGYYSLMDSCFNYSGTFKVLETKDGKFALNAGYAGRAKETMDKGIIAISGKLLQLKDYVNVPILDLIVFDPYISVGYGRINIREIDNSEFDVGIGANIIKINF